MKKGIVGIGLMIVMSLFLEAEGNRPDVINIDFEKTKVIDVFDKKSKKKNNSIKGVCKYPKTPQSYTKLADRLVGTWSAYNQEGFVKVAGMTMPLPAETKPERGFVLYMQGGELVVNPPKGEPMVLKFAKDKGWKFDKKNYYKDFLGKRVKQTISPGMTHEEIGFFADCNPNDLPRLVGKTTFNIDGKTMHATYRFVVLSDSIMYGIMNYTGKATGGYGYDAKRSFAFTRE